MANRLLADRDAPPVGKRWASNFVKRHKELKTRYFRTYDYQRAKCEDPPVMRNWFRLVENTIAFGNTIFGTTSTYRRGLGQSWKDREVLWQ
ncbi:hypothetical protein BFJ70_g16936 [Fusarium oxysporum]|nr:hypothetical protein BFJ70_g16936 [Fusarium oxysporum]